MAEHTKIEWTDATWNPITGCSVVSPGCTNCYAMKLAGTRLDRHPSRAGLTKQTKAGPVWTGEVRFNEQWLTQPLQWKRPRRIFVCAHGDLFHESVPDEWIDKVFAVMALAPQHTFQVLTKRAKRMREYCVSLVESEEHFERFCDALVTNVGDYTVDHLFDTTLPLPNVWLGISAEDQQRADERIPDLLATPAAVRWVSAEPLLGQIDFSKWTASPGQVGDYRGGQVFLDDEMRMEHLQDGEHVARPVNLPSSNRLPPLPRSARVIPSDITAESTQPIHDLGSSAIDGEARGVGSIRSAAPIKVPFPVEQSSEIANLSLVCRNDDGLRETAWPTNSEIDTLALKTAPDVRSVKANESADLGKGFAVLVERNKFPIHGENHNISWVVVGGESGPGARPMHPDWARSIRDQCQAAGVAFNFKQWGGVNKKATGRLLDSRTWDEYPGGNNG